MKTTTHDALAAISDDELDTMRLAFLTMRDEFAVICDEASGLGYRDREIYNWHAAKIETAENMLQRIRAEMVARAENKGQSDV